MNYMLNDNESFTAHKGKVLSIEKYVATTIKGETKHSVFTGTDFSVSSSSDLITKAKVHLSSGRTKEFDIDDVEMQEGDDVEFVTTDSGWNVYVKNFTTGKSEIVEPTYLRPDFLQWVGIGGVVAIIYGIYKIKSSHGFLAGLAGFGLIGVAVMVVAAFFFMFKNRVATLNSEFQKRVLATGVSVGDFKRPSVI